MPVEQIERLAGTTAPPNPPPSANYGMQRVRGGGNAVRAVACPPAVTGGAGATGRPRRAVGLGISRLDRATLHRP